MYAGPDDLREGGERRSSQPGFAITIRSPKGWCCITQHFVLCGTYSSLGQEYSAAVTCHVTVALEGEPAACPPPRPRGSHAIYYLPLGRKLRRRSCIVGEVRSRDDSLLRRPGDWPGHRRNHAEQGYEARRCCPRGLCAGPSRGGRGSRSRARSRGHPQASLQPARR
jgi:hypothetical protein